MQRWKDLRQTKLSMFLRSSSLQGLHIFKLLIQMKA